MTGLRSPRTVQKYLAWRHRLSRYVHCPVAIGLLASVVLGCHQPPASNEKQAGKQASAPPIKAYLLTIQPEVWPTIARCQGSLIPDDIAVVGSKVSGMVGQVHIDLGDAVEKDTSLATLDQAEFILQVEASAAALLQSRSAVGLKPGDPVNTLDPLNSPPVREARAILDESRSKRDRGVQLRAQNAMAEEELQMLNAAEKVADARYSSAINGVNEKIALISVRAAEADLAKQRLEETRIVAPFVGHVQQRHVSPGAFVQIGSPIATIVRTDVLRFRGTVPERIAPALRLGQSIQLQIQLANQHVTATITRISPALDMQSRSLSFEAAVNNKTGVLQAGLFAEAEIILDDQAKAIVIPESALVEFAGAEKVWIVQDGNANERLIRAGRRDSRKIEIVEGLKPGDTILLNGSQGRVAKVEPLAANATTSSGLTNAPIAVEQPAISGTNGEGKLEQPAG